MSNTRRQRGRPKGSGINDWERLLSIASVMEKNPKLKVTTAIKELGFVDPSVIRRLRDKFKANQHKLLGTPKRVSRAMPTAMAGDVADSCHSASLLRTTDDVLRSSIVPPISGGGANDNPRPALERNFGDSLPWLKLTLQSAAMVSNAQMMCLHSLLAQPSAALLLQHQALVTELTMINLQLGKALAGQR